MTFLLLTSAIKANIEHNFCWRFKSILTNSSLHVRSLFIALRNILLISGLSSLYCYTIMSLLFCITILLLLYCHNIVVVLVLSHWYFVTVAGAAPWSQENIWECPIPISQRNVARTVESITFKFLQLKRAAVYVPDEEFAADCVRIKFYYCSPCIHASRGNSGWYKYTTVTLIL